MTRRVTDLSAEDLDAIARKTWAREAEASLDQGLAVTYAEGGKVYRRWPDGRRECLATDDGGKAKPRAVRAGA